MRCVGACAHSARGTENCRPVLTALYTDTRQAILDLDTARQASWFAVFDGHGGKEVAKFCALRLHTAFAEQPAWHAGRIEDALVESFLAMDREMRTDAGRKTLQSLAEEGMQQGSGEGGGSSSAAAGSSRDGTDGASPERSMSWYDPSRDAPGMPAGSPTLGMFNAADDEDDGFLGPDTDDCGAGCTSVVAVVVAGVLYVANAGDSRAVMCRDGGSAHDMSVDHKPTLEGEKARILAAGGFVADGRVKGSLALSRAIGDLGFKQTPGLGPEAQMVTAMPDVRVEQLRAGDEFVILACDGIWDVMSSQQAVDFVRERLRNGATPSEVCAALCDACMAPNTQGMGLGCDNMSVVLCVFKPAMLLKEKS